MSELTKAFIKAQSEFPRIGKDGKADTGKFSYTYATLPSVMDAVLPVLHKHGLALMQTFDNGHLVTTLVHGGDDDHVSNSLNSFLPVPMSNVSPQDLGKWITYLRRYAIVAMLGLAPDDDDDAAGVNVPPPQPKSPPPQSDPPPPADPIDAAVVRLLTDDRDLLKTYEPSIKNLGDARAAARDVIGRLNMLPDADADSFYKAARGYMNSIVDERAAVGEGF